MVVGMLVLGSCLLCIVGIIANFRSHRRGPILDENAIRTVEDIGKALSIQQNLRVADLQRRIDEGSWLAYALLAAAFLMQIGALVADHFAHASIALVNILPALVIVVSGRASKRREVQRQLDKLLERRPILS